MKKKVIELTDTIDGIDKISLVENPAIEIDFMTFSKNHNKSNYTLAKTNVEKRLLIGPALVPNKEIYRFDQETGEEYYVWFSEETVEKISQKYLINNKQSNVNIEHETDVEDIILVESWIVNNPDNDKANSLGFNVPKGTWMCSMKVLNEDVWNNLVKPGEVKGLSIEGNFIEKFSNNTKPPVIDEDSLLIDKIKELLENI